MSINSLKRSQSLAGYIRQHLDELEARLEFGVRQEVLVAELETLGYRTTLKGFRNFLYRARLRAAERKANANPPRTESLLASAVRPSPRPVTQASSDPLTASKGFAFTGTAGVDVSELI